MHLIPLDMAIFNFYLSQARATNLQLTFEYATFVVVNSGSS
jgi:hypothetical protein